MEPTYLTGRRTKCYLTAVKRIDTGHKWTHKVYSKNRV